MPNTDNPLVSIIVCCYNREHLLQKTMESIFAQHYRPVEIIVLDDGSTDGTSDLMRRYGDKIRYYRQENQGIALTRKNACLLAEGEYIAFQDDDDIMPPDRITTLIKAIFQYPDAVFAVGDWEIIDADGKLTGKRYLPENHSRTPDPILIRNGYEAVLWPKVPATPHTVLFKKVYGEKIGWFDTQYKNAGEDKDFFARIGQLGPIVYVPKVVSYYRRGHESLTASKSYISIQQLKLFENHMNRINIKSDPLYKRLQFRILAELKKISFLEHIENASTGPDHGKSIKKAIALLSWRYRFQYVWYRLVRMKIRKLVKSCSFSKKKSEGPYDE